MPDWLGQIFPGHRDYPPGVVVFIVVLALSFVAARELVKILRDKGIEASMRLCCASAMIGLAVSCLVPTEFKGEHSATIVSSAAALVLVISLAFYSGVRSSRASSQQPAAPSWPLSISGSCSGSFRRSGAAQRVDPPLDPRDSQELRHRCLFHRKGDRQAQAHPWLSPGKTWEGLVGGVIFSAAVGAFGVEVLREYGHTSMPTWQWGALAGVLFALVAQMGDLMASLLKRDAGVKDAGKIFRGSGDAGCDRFAAAGCPSGVLVVARGRTPRDARVNRLSWLKSGAVDERDGQASKSLSGGQATQRAYVSSESGRALPRRAGEAAHAARLAKVHDRGADQATGGNRRQPRGRDVAPRCPHRAPAWPDELRSDESRIQGFPHRDQHNQGGPLQDRDRRTRADGPDRRSQRPARRDRHQPRGSPEGPLCRRRRTHQACRRDPRTSRAAQERARGTRCRGSHNRSERLPGALRPA
ncbi:MAG: phosphatidate cytidylyltransferase [Phycisphaeraceae bacterium]|nr:phosphatidate cytidylyltransferase [Phycisphaeraceae bacterium]